MANHPSALKRHRQSRKRRIRNRAGKSRLHSIIRSVTEAIASGDKAVAQDKLQVASVALAKAASKGLIHRANASRRTSRMARHVAKLG